MDCEPYPDEMFEEAERREAENKQKPLDAFMEFLEKTPEEFGQLSYVGRLEKEEEMERREKSNRILQRYNDYYNMECAALPHGTPITPEHTQAITLECMVDALRCENLNREYNEIAITDIENLIEALYEQGNDFLERVKEFKDSADGVV